MSDGTSYFRTGEQHLKDAERAATRVDTVTADRHMRIANVYFTAAIAYALNNERIRVRSIVG